MRVCYFADNNTVFYCAMQNFITSIALTSKAWYNRLSSKERKPTTMKTINLKVSDETHRRLRLLAAAGGLTAGEIITDLIDREWNTRSKDLLKVAKP